MTKKTLNTSEQTYLFNFFTLFIIFSILIVVPQKAQSTEGFKQRCKGVFNLKQKIGRVFINKNTIYTYFSKKEALRPKAKQRSAVLMYKNQPSAGKPTSVNLNNQSLKLASNKLIKIFGEYKPNEHEQKNFIADIVSVYAEKVLLLRKGDSVIAEGQTFELGNFVGAGDATHVFQLANDPSKVIRIPLASQNNANQNGLAQMDAYLNIYFEGQLNDSVPHVKIYSPQEHRTYVITDFVNGTLDGRQFYNSYRKQLTPSAIDKKMFERLKQLYKSANHSTYRQFIWDKDTDDWRLIDWE